MAFSQFTDFLKARVLEIYITGRISSRACIALAEASPDLTLRSRGEIKGISWYERNDRDNDSTIPCFEDTLR